MLGHLYRYADPTDASKVLYVGQGDKRDSHHRNGQSSFGRRFKKRFPNIELPQPVRWTVEVANQLELNEEETIAMFQYRSWRGYGGMNLTLPGSADYEKLGKCGDPILKRKNGLAAKERGDGIFAPGVAALGGKAVPLEARVRGGCISGARNRDNGRMCLVGKEGGRVVGKRHKENGTGIFAMKLEERQIVGRKSAVTNMTNKTSIFAPGMNSKGGRIGGRKGKNLDPEFRTARGIKGGSVSGPLNCHTRWHVRRGIVNPKCVLCNVAA